MHKGDFQNGSNLKKRADSLPAVSDVLQAVKIRLTGEEKTESQTTACKRQGMKRPQTVDKKKPGKYSCRAVKNS
ncbi:hypothetical protein [Desulfobulbus sp.]|uniref:hypothetical protein n=1 Tax=Desulfobulbus sp. TaxID=895 RepID=UPI0027BA8ECB|nr:hypothetical protein [Desulfobulbus sp.]